MYAPPLLSRFLAPTLLAGIDLDWLDSFVSVPVWLIVIGAGLVGMLVAALAMSVLQRHRDAAASADDERPTQIELFGIGWRWRYNGDGICDLQSYCPKCGRTVSAAEEKRHGFLNLISYSCACGKWQSKSFQCSQDAMIDRVAQTIQQQVRS